MLRVLATPRLSSEETINAKMFSVFTLASHQSESCISQMQLPASLANTYEQEAATTG